MANELQILKKIWENKGETSVKLISDQTRLGPDYVRYLCNCLIKERKIKPVRKKPGWYRITAKGKKKLKLLGIFKPKIFKKVLKEDRGIKKVILPWPKGLLKMRLPKNKKIAVEEKKLRLEKTVEKTAKGRKKEKRKKYGRR